MNTYAYRELELDFKEWLALLGYADNTVYNMPLYVHEFFHWLENDQVRKIEHITGEHVHDFILHLKKRPHARRGGKISNAHINKYHQGIVLLSQFVRQTNRGTFTVETQRLAETRAIPDILTMAEVKELYKACDASVPLGRYDNSLFYCGKASSYD